MFPFNVFSFPFTDFNKLNMDWVLSILEHLQGGETGQFLAKKTDDDYDFEWIQGGTGGVISVNGQTGVVTLFIPTKTSELSNDSNFIPAPAAPSSGDVLTWNGSAWIASALPLYNGGVG